MTKVEVFQDDKKKDKAVSCPVYHSYKLQPFLRKRLKAEQRLISELSDYNKSIKGGDFRCNNSFPYQIVASIKFGYLST